MRNLHVYVCAVVVMAGVAAARADVVDTFDNNVNHGTWRLTSNPNRLYQIEPTGGNPGAYLHAQVSTAVPTWYIDSPTGNPYTGDFVAEGIQSFKFDMTISGGVQVPDRNMTLHLITTLGTGDLLLGIEAYYIGTDISTFTPAWATHSYPLNASSATIPTGWVVTEGNGNAGTNADWHSLVTHIENVTMDLGTPGYFYPNLGVWDLGLDNVALSTTPLPAPGVVGLIVAGLPLAARRRR